MAECLGTFLITKLVFDVSLNFNFNKEKNLWKYFNLLISKPILYYFLFVLFPFCGEAIVFGRGVRDWRRLSDIRMLFKPESKTLWTFWMRYQTSQGAGKAFFHLCPLRALYSAKSSENRSINLPKNSPTST